jgi:hypothetical protein
MWGKPLKLELYNFLSEEKKLEKGEKQSKFWQQNVPVESRIFTRTYHFAKCNAPLFSVPAKWAILNEKEVVSCPKVPAFHRYESELE